MRKYTLLIICIVVLIPFLGLTQFYSKGEPREAVVALSMINDGNWILPINNGGDIPYKPPFFHWCIALLSFLTGGVNEFSSRLPSALSLIIATISSYVFYFKRKNKNVAFLTALFLLTAFETHRAAMASRVDMMLAMFIVLALYAFYSWWEKGSKGVPFVAILFMSGATLTKGPIGFILPCFVMGVFMIIKGYNILRLIFKFISFSLLSCVLPALWYIAAYKQGGDAFFNLVIEENFGRMLGRMSYDSHVHPFTYNFVSLIAGWLPYTLLLIFSFFMLHFKNIKNSINKKINIAHFIKSLKNKDSVELFTWLSFVLILFFYCIPSSKRSTYLLPCYPFMAYLFARYVEWVNLKNKKIVKLFANTISTISLILIIALFAVKQNLVPYTIFKGKHAADNILMIKNLCNSPITAFQWCIIFISIVIAVYILINKTSKIGNKLTHLLFLPVISIYFMLDGVILPKVLNASSDKDLGQYIEQKFKNKTVYSYINSPMMHFFCTNFYANNTIRQFELDKPKHGILMISQGHFAYFKDKHKNYKFKLIAKTTRRRTETKDVIWFLSF